ncbi:MAG: hypothetical protein JO108_14985 [Acidobacteriaceae bacterium]|nr:hypothetical protein [Acidobacteriaceae bacterium]
MTFCLLKGAEQQSFHASCVSVPKHPGAPAMPAIPTEVEVIEGMPVQCFMTGHVGGQAIPLRPSLCAGSPEPAKSA